MKWVILGLLILAMIVVLIGTFWILIKLMERPIEK